MAYVYRYIDPDDRKIKYVGIVWGENRTLYNRVKEHEKEKWHEDKRWIIEYIAEGIDNKSEADAFESHYVSLYNPCYNISKVGWGINKYLPDRENDWIIYKPEDFKTKTISRVKKVKKITKKQNNNLKDNESEVFFEQNEKSIKLVEFVIDQLINFNFYITQLRKNNYSFRKMYRLEYDVIIEGPDLLSVDEIPGTIKSKNGFINIYQTIFQLKDNDKYYMVFDVSKNNLSIFHGVEVIHKIACDVYGENNIPEKILTLKEKSDYLFNHWDEIVDINSSVLYKAPSEDPGKKMMRRKNHVAARNNSYFWEWYIGCTLIYTDGCGFYFYKDGEFSEYVLDYSDNFEYDDYYLEEYIDYYLGYWAIELDRVIWVTSLGGVFCGDDYYGFEATGNMVGDIKCAMDIIKINGIKTGVGTKHE